MPHAMDFTDTEMTDREVAMPVQGSADDVVKELLTLARQLISQGNPTQALQAVIMAMRTKGGDDAVFQSLHRARQLYINRLQEHSDVDHLASLFAECAIVEAQPFISESSPNDGGTSLQPNAQGNSILAETGRMQIVLDAFSDGSSFICLQCGGLVSNHRKDEHYAYWCSKL